MVVTLFVNPTQFGPGEDLGAYPRDPDGDAAAATRRRRRPPVHAVGRRDVPGAGAHDRPRRRAHERLCGASRPTHFDGVTTVVAKLFSIVGPCRAYFGRKDAQQLAVVRRMATDLEPARSTSSAARWSASPTGSRCRAGTRTSPQTSAGRRRAVSRGLHAAAAAVVDGERSAAAIRELVVAAIACEPLLALEYAEVVDATSLEPVSAAGGHGAGRSRRARRPGPPPRQRHVHVRRLRHARR